jgi:phage tail P2-like protein
MNNTLFDADFLKALPPPLREDERLLALGKIAAERLRETATMIKQNIIYARIDELPEAILDMLAYDMKVDWWDYTYTLDEKRRTLKESPSVHRIKGTKAAVERAVSAIYPNSKVTEWFEYGGEPYKFRLHIKLEAGGEIDTDKHGRVLAGIEYYKNLRSHLDGVEYTAEGKTESRICAGVAGVPAINIKLFAVVGE